MATGYPTFLDQARLGLTRLGARSLLTPDLVDNRADWTLGWDLLMALEVPGTGTVYAFTPFDVPEEQIRERIDRLAFGLAGSGASRPTGLRLVAICVSTAPLASRVGKHLARLRPSTFYAGLRPSTWVVDLAGGLVLTGRPGSADDRAVILAAARGSLEGEILTAAGTGVLERHHSERTDAFYGLMRGRQPLVTYALIVLNVVIFLLLEANSGASTSGSGLSFGNLPDSTLQSFGALSPQLIEQGQWWRMFTAIFLHASVPHILFNMASLFAVGTLAERLYGNVRYLAIYLGSGLIGSVVSVLYAVLSGHPDVLGVGASGAIFGVAGALITIRFQHSDVIPRALRYRVSTSMIPLVVLSLVFAFLTPQVDNGAHIGGLLGGMGLSFLFPLTRTVSVRR